MPLVPDLTITAVTDPVPLETIAAVDLGSNSFHMIVARLSQGELQIVDRLREPVRLGSGLDEKNRLRPEAAEAALACLERFGQRVRDLPPEAMRAVGTNTLRKARKAGDFLAQAERALGHPIEIISGVEEARLIYLGVAHSLSHNGGQRLVMDIGGGSTELIIGQGFEPLHLESLYMGCVSVSQTHFSEGRISRERWRAADLAARLELEPVKRAYRKLGWEQVSGASGTIRAVRDVVRAAEWSETGITLESLRRLRKELLKAEHIDELKLKGLQEDRQPVFVGGVAILLATFEVLGIEHMMVSDGALREGLLYDTVGRLQHHDVREAAVSAMEQRHHIDSAHGARVETTALALLEQVDEDWGLKDIEAWHMLRWAARLHEVGLVIAHSQYQKHGAYLLANSDLPGFSRQDQALLAALVRGHRRKLPLEVFRALPEAVRPRAESLCILLRLAVLLHRNRSSRALPEVRAEVKKHRLVLCFPDAWLDGHALTLADLERERAYLKAMGLALVLEQGED